MKTAVRVISMPEASARRSDFTRAAELSQVPWDFFDAARSCEAPLNYDERRAIRRFGRPLSPGELGCYSSHFQLWQWLLQSSYDQLIVFEDDVTIDWHVVAILAANDMEAIGIGVLRLFTTHPFRFEVARYKFLSDHSHLLRLKGHAYGTQGYLITRQGATALVACGLRIDAPVDWVISRYWQHGAAQYCLSPAPLFEKHGTSTIGHGQGEEFIETFSNRVLRQCWNGIERLRRWKADRLIRSPADFLDPADCGAAYIKSSSAP